MRASAAGALFLGALLFTASAIAQEPSNSSGKVDAKSLTSQSWRIGWATNDFTSLPISRQSSFTVRLAPLRSAALSFENAISIGLRSGE